MSMETDITVLQQIHFSEVSVPSVVLSSVFLGFI